MMIRQKLFGFRTTKVICVVCLVTMSLLLPLQAQDSSSKAKQFEGKLAFHQDIPVGLVSGSVEHPRLIEMNEIILFHLETLDVEQLHESVIVDFLHTYRFLLISLLRVLLYPDVRDDQTLNQFYVLRKSHHIQYLHLSFSYAPVFLSLCCSHKSD